MAYQNEKTAPADTLHEHALKGFNGAMGAMPAREKFLPCRSVVPILAVESVNTGLR